jgi:long-chain acyl-CoA synthetase
MNGVGRPAPVVRSGQLAGHGPLRNNLGCGCAAHRQKPLARPFTRTAPSGQLKQLLFPTETAAFVCPHDDQARADTVGVPIKGVIGRHNGEIMVKSPACQGTRQKPGGHASATADGWYHTSDAGFDMRTHLKIIDRVKDVGRIKGGANDGAMFAPASRTSSFFPHQGSRIWHCRDRLHHDQYRLRCRHRSSGATAVRGYTDWRKNRGVPAGRMR